MNITDQKKKYFINLYAIALADDNVDPKELKFLYELGKEKGFNREDIDELLLNPGQLVAYQPETFRDKIEHLYMAAGMVLADGRIDKRERIVFKSICLHMGFIEENIPELMDFMIEQVQQGVPFEKVLEIAQKNAEE